MKRKTTDIKDDVVWHSTRVSPDERERLSVQKPLTIWLTGLSASGKSTLAFALEKFFVENGRSAFVLDGDNVRHGLCKDLGFTAQDRSENIRRVAEVANLMNDAGVMVMVACISPSSADRDNAKSIIGEERFLEVYLSTPLSVCEQLDPKGLYRKARAGQIPHFTGVSAPYEVPAAPALKLDASELSVADCLQEILSKVAI
ncbi:adenylyl-sulfate kinase [Pseudomonas sp. MF6776]|jgi:adenylylsulfate kinase|uniref:adenylyl-sulfate kinase n=1 Tax=Pseudomonas sp. MF6776 TaxID=2797534 RepID=UPI00190D35CE|nr:adenylyl-sulfate kinase [Pseudomonas sp. MF6776]MBA4272604.1 adenylyl-sulfate kinase [Pseudomonas sp.]MBK3464560.1 adenylyl-sulfate kinase [Pseudomonas sp. MF6776]